MTSKQFKDDLVKNGYGFKDSDSSHSSQSDMKSLRNGFNYENKRKKSRTEEFSETDSYNDCCSNCLISLSVLLIIVTFPVSLLLVVKIVKEYEKAIIFRLGRLLKSAKGAGIQLCIPCTDDMITIDIRTTCFEICNQEILSKDSVTVSVDVVVYYRITDPLLCVTRIVNPQNSVQLLASAALRNVLGMQTMSAILSDRTTSGRLIQSQLDEVTNPWGIQVEKVEMKDVRLPQSMQRAMAAEAEASREAKAKEIAAEGELKSADALQKAATLIQASPAALQLRYLQTLNTIAAEKNSTIIFPIPIEFCAFTRSTSSEYANKT